MLSLYSLPSQVLRNIGHCVYSVCARARERVYVNIILSEGVSRYITRPIPSLKLNGSFDLTRCRNYLHNSMKVGILSIHDIINCNFK